MKDVACTQGEGQGGGFVGQSTFDPHPNPPPEYMGREKFSAAIATHPRHCCKSVGARVKPGRLPPGKRRIGD